MSVWSVGFSEGNWGYIDVNVKRDLRRRLSSTSKGSVYVIKGADRDTQIADGKSRIQKCPADAGGKGGHGRLSNQSAAD